MATRRDNGDGYIAEHADSRGLYRGYITVGRDEHGKPKRQWLSAKTQPALKAKLKIAQREHEQGMDISPARLTVSDYLWDWLKNVKRRSIAEATFISYEVIVRVHLAPGLGHHKLKELTPQHVDRYIARKLDEGMSARSVQYQISLLRSVLKTAQKHSIILRNVAQLVDSPKVEPQEIRPLTLDQANTFLAFLRVYPDPHRGPSKDKEKDKEKERSTSVHNNYALYAVMLNLGLRRGEVLGLKWEDVNMDAGTISVRAGLQRLSGHVQRTDVKTRSSRRTLSLPASVMVALGDHRTLQAKYRDIAGPKWKETGYIFTTRHGGPIEPRTINRQFDLLLKKAGLPHFRVHDARHTNATIMRDAGVPIETVSRRLGHSRISTTSDIYLHPTQAADQAAAQRLDELFR